MTASADKREYGEIDPVLGALLVEWEQMRDEHLARRASSDATDGDPSLIPFIEQSDAIIMHPGRSAADVILKYFIIRELTANRVSFVTEILKDGEAPWPYNIRDEAKQFGVTLNEFWLDGAVPLAIADGVGEPELWAVIGR